ncbi:MAG: hypothetical protein HY233_04235, partial [Acidobacteriales bacterium]|nr:hypothetical protein [Terriglobales bacterium]
LIGTTTRYTFLPGFNFQNGYTYDAASNRTSLTAPDGSTNTYNYDTLNRLATLTNSLTGQFGFGYDALSRRTQLTRPNGINTNYSYDSVSRLLSVLHQAGSTTLDGASYGYDFAGNRTSKTNYLNGITEGYTSGNSSHRAFVLVRTQYSGRACTLRRTCFLLVSGGRGFPLLVPSSSPGVDRRFNHKRW